MKFPHSARILTAGILSLPAFLLLITVAPFVFLLAIPSISILIRRKRQFLPSFPSSSCSSIALNPNSLLNHAIITGGSSGIGLSIAIELAKRKCCHITLLARRKDQLIAAKKIIEMAAASVAQGHETNTSNNATHVHIISVDITNFQDLQREAKLLCGPIDVDRMSHNANESVQTHSVVGPPTLLFNCAGYAIPLSFIDLSHSDFRAQVDVNYLGSIHVVKAFLPYMTQNCHNSTGNIILTSSMSGQVGSFGYSAYSPTKFALRGFAESLSMELDARGVNVNVSLAYPPDTKTPGYQAENENKPEECRLISESGGVWDPQVVGGKIVEESLSENPRFDIYFGMDGWMLSMLTAGMNPVTTLFDALCQVAVKGLLRYISLFYLMDFRKIVQKCHDEKSSNKKEYNTLKTD